MEEALLKELAAARSHHLTLSIAQLVTLLLVLLGGGFFLHTQLQNFAKAQAVAETHYKEFVEQSKQTQQTVTDNTKQQAAIDITVHQRDETTDKKIETVTAPDRTLQQTQQDAKTVLGADSTITADNKLAFQQWDVKAFVGTKLDRDRLSGDLEATKSNLLLEKGKTAALQDTLTKATSVAKEERKVAQMSKWHRVWNKAEPWVLAVGTAYAANKLSQH